MHLSDYVYKPLVESPGIAHVINLAEFSPANTQPLIKSIFSAWPVILLTIMTAYLSGIIIWILVSEQAKTEFVSLVKLKFPLSQR